MMCPDLARYEPVVQMHDSVISCHTSLNECRTIVHDSDYSCIVYSSKIRVQIMRGKFELAVHDAALSQRFSHSPIFTGLQRWLVQFPTFPFLEFAWALSSTAKCFHVPEEKDQK